MFVCYLYFFALLYNLCFFLVQVSVYPRYIMFCCCYLTRGAGVHVIAYIFLQGIPLSVPLSVKFARAVEVGHAEFTARCLSKRSKIFLGTFLAYTTESTVWKHKLMVCETRYNAHTLYDTWVVHHHQVEYTVFSHGLSYHLVEIVVRWDAKDDIMEFFLIGTCWHTVVFPVDV